MNEVPNMAICSICHRTLRDPVSQRRGIGPVCWRKLYPEDRSRPSRPRRRTRHPKQMELMFADETAGIEDDGLDIR
jgi:hypothetical protein